MEKQSLIRRTLASPGGFARLAGILEEERKTRRWVRVSEESDPADGSESLGWLLPATLPIADESGAREAPRLYALRLPHRGLAQDSEN